VSQNILEIDPTGRETKGMLENEPPIRARPQSRFVHNAEQQLNPAVEVFKTFTFEAADYLPNVVRGHKGGDLHCHTFKLIVGVKGVAHPRSGFVVDFATIDAAVRPLINQLDRNLLNEVIGNPTCENLAVWLWNRLGIPGLSSLELWDTPTSGCKMTAAHDVSPSPRTYRSPSGRTNTANRIRRPPRATPGAPGNREPGLPVPPR
jgi:6-pyruvoyltetrahydropterin/6-carboxytetrahydropterin synthase